MKEKVPLIFILPFLVTLFMVTVTIIQPGYDQGSLTDHSIANQIGLGGAYLLAASLVVIGFSKFKALLISAYPIGGLLLLITISLLWSSFPLKVVISATHQLGMVLVVMCAARYLMGSPVRYYIIVQLFVIIYMMATIVVTVKWPGIGIMKSGYWDLDLRNRWQGLSGHANNLGQICVFGGWVSMIPFLLKNKNGYTYLLSLIGSVLSVYVLYRTNSIASSIVMFFVFSLGFFFWLNRKLRRVSNALRYTLYGFVVLIFLSSLFIFFPEMFSIEYVLRLMGRDKTLTGRLTLWEIGIQGFEQKPMLGWSYDGLRTFLGQFNLGYGQLHSGYLDLAVRGGFIGFFVFVLVLFQAIKGNIIGALRNNTDSFHIAAIVWLLATLVYSLAEAVLVRNTSLFWLIFLLSYFIGLENRQEKQSEG